MPRVLRRFAQPRRNTPEEGYCALPLRQFGVIEIDRKAFPTRLEDALKQAGDFSTLPATFPGAQALDVIADGDHPSA
jgi:hypothetical protein